LKYQRWHQTAAHTLRISGNSNNKRSAKYLSLTSKCSIFNAIQQPQILCSFEIYMMPSSDETAHQRHNKGALWQQQTLELTTPWAKSIQVEQTIW
jgi:hypothetical protein